MNRKADYVLDSTAVLAYGQGSSNILDILGDANRTGGIVAVPVTCLAEAYKETPYKNTEPFRGLMGLDCVWPWLLLPDDAPMVGNLAYHRQSRLGLAHAIHLALSNAAILVTDSDLDDILPEDWPRLAPLSRHSAPDRAHRVACVTVAIRCRDTRLGSVREVKGPDRRGPSCRRPA